MSFFILTIAKKLLIKLAIALMAELVDAQVSGTCDRFGRGSSSLLQGTKKSSSSEGIFLVIRKRPNFQKEV